MKKKSTEEKKYPRSQIQINLVNEAATKYEAGSKKQPYLVKDFTFSDFDKIAKESPFTLSDWAEMLSISERTLQRYAKENSSFNGLQTERILQLKNFIALGNEMFGKEGFKNWMDFKPLSLNGLEVKDLMYSHAGIEAAGNLIQKMQHGIPA